MRLEVVTRRLLRQLAQALAVGALGAAALAGAPVAAADCNGVNTVICTGDINAGVCQGPPVTSLTVLASWRFGSDSFYARPMVEVSPMGVDTDGFTETGAGALNLVVPGQSTDTTRASFKVEVGGEISQGEASARPYARIGLSSLASGAESPFTAGFQAAPGGINPFDVKARLDKTTLDAELGVTVVGERGSARLGWSGQFGERVSNQTFGVKLTLAF